MPFPFDYLRILSFVIIGSLLETPHLSFACLHKIFKYLCCLYVKQTNPSR